MRYYQITDAAKKVDVESHVLRYWEEELHLPIERNKQGHRLYTEEDLNRFMYIKELKKEGLQLRAIRARIHKVEDWTKSEAPECETDTPNTIIHRMEEKEKAAGRDVMRIQIKNMEEDRQEKAAKLCMMLQQMVGQAVRQENKNMISEVKRCVAETVSKEMDYQFRLQEQRDEEHFQKVDELLRMKSGRKGFLRKKSRDEAEEKEGTQRKETEQSIKQDVKKEMQEKTEEKNEKKDEREEEKAKRTEGETQEAVERKVPHSRKKRRGKRKNKMTKAQRDKEMLMENKRRTSG